MWVSIIAHQPYQLLCNPSGKPRTTSLGSSDVKKPAPTNQKVLWDIAGIVSRVGSFVERCLFKQLARNIMREYERDLTRSIYSPRSHHMLAFRPCIVFCNDRKGPLRCYLSVERAMQKRLSDTC
jgi:hypothetical protein